MQLPKPESLGDQDHISDEGLDKIHALVPDVAQDFELNVNASAKSVQATFKFEHAGDVIKRGESIFALAEAAMWLDALCKNLRAERERTLGVRDRIATMAATHGSASDGTTSSWWREHLSDLATELGDTAHKRIGDENNLRFRRGEIS